MKAQPGRLTDWEMRLAMVSNQALPTEKYSAPVSTPRATPHPQSLAQNSGSEPNYRIRNVLALMPASAKQVLE